MGLLFDKNTGIEISAENGIYILKSQERFILEPQEKKLIHFNLKVQNKNIKDFLMIKIDFDLALKGISLLADNLNDNSAEEGIRILIINNNPLDTKSTQISRLIGSRNRIDVLSGTILGRILKV